MALLTSLQAYYKLDESSGNASDSSGNGNTLTNVNTATFSAGKINNGANLVAASSQYFSITDAAQTGLDLSGDFTFSLWYKLTDLVATYRKIIVKSSSTDTNLAYDLSVYPNATDPQFILFLSSAGTYGPYETYAATGQGTGGWHMLTVSYTASTHVGAWYIDGSAVTPTVSGTMPTSIYNSAEAFEIGGRQGAYTMNGSLDEVGVWSRALSSTEVTELYNGGAGFQYPFSTYILTCVAGAFTLTGNAIALLYSRVMTATVGAFTLTGVNVLFTRGWGIVAQVGTFVLTGIDTAFRFSGWTSQSKNTATIANQIKNSASWVDQSKNNATITNQTKH